MTPAEFVAALDSGWVRQSGADQFVLSRRGASLLRRVLNQAAAAAAAVGPSEVPVAPREARQRVPLQRTAPGLNVSESPLAWLRQHKDKDGAPLISQVEFEAGERLRRDFETAQLRQRVTAAYDTTLPGGRERRSGPDAGLELSERALAARQRLEAAIDAVGPKLSDVLIDVCCLLIGLEQAERNGGWPRRSGKVMLQVALSHLARHYRMLPPSGGGGHGGSGQIGHWGAPGYRPRMVDRGSEGRSGDQAGA